MKNINLDKYGGADIFHWTHEYLVKVITMGKHRIVRYPLLKNAFRKIRRDDFVPDEYRAIAFEDKDIAIGYGQTLNKPTAVAQMLQLLKPVFGGIYLDIGTGTGWFAALLAMCVGADGKVYSVERVQYLVDLARANFIKYPNIGNVQIIFRDGSLGLPERAPYDGIHASAAYAEIPDALINQLKIGGRMVAPTLEHDVRLIERISKDEFRETKYKGFFFEPVKEGVE